MREFESGATRDDDEEKYDYAGFLSPLVLERYAMYMHVHRRDADGNLRASDNWQKGIPQDAYMKSLLRHVIDVWTFNRIGVPSFNGKKELEDSLCAVIFNAMGYLFELLKEEE